MFSTYNIPSSSLIIAFEFITVFYISILFGLQEKNPPKKQTRIICNNAEAEYRNHTDLLFKHLHIQAFILLPSG